MPNKVRVVPFPIAPQTIEAAMQPSIWRRLGISVLVLLHHTFALAPLLALGFLYIMSWRAESVIGHWPQPSVDDPKYIMPADWLYNLLYLSSPLAMLATMSAIIVLPVLTLLLWRKYPHFWPSLMIVVYVVGLVILKSDLGRRIAWYLD